MSRLNKNLFLGVTLELLAAICLMGWQLAKPAPPLSNLEWTDSLTASEIKNRYANLRQEEGRDWERLADAYLAFGAYPEADACYRRASELGNASRDMDFDWGLCLDKMGLPSEAMERYQAGIQHSSTVQNTNLCWYLTGKDLLRLDRVADAEEAFEKAGELLSAWCEKAKILARSGRAAQAQALLEKWLAKYPKMMEFNMLNARVLAELGRENEARNFREIAGRALESALPDIATLRLCEIRAEFSIEKRFRNCQELKAAGELENAGRGLRELSAIQWEPHMAMHLIDIELQLGHGVEALKLLEEFAAKCGSSPTILAYWGDAYAISGAPSKAVEAWTRAVRMNGMEKAHAALARRYGLSGELLKALEHRALGMHAKALAAFWQENTKEARTLLESVVQLNPKLASTWYYLGECRRLLDDKPGAREAYQRCLEIDPVGQYGRAQMRLEGLGVQAGPVPPAPEKPGGGAEKK